MISECCLNLNERREENDVHADSHYLENDCVISYA